MKKLLLLLTVLFLSTLICCASKIDAVDECSFESFESFEETTIEEETETESNEIEITIAPYLYERCKMYSTTRLNVRMGPGTDYDIYKTVPINFEFDVMWYDLHHIWEMIELDDSIYFVASEYLSFEKTVVVENKIKYYGVWTGAYWHFTPEQIDNQWAGKKTSKAKLEEGTTRAWQKYLYEKLKERNLEWFYKYAVAQAMQESGMNPLNNYDYSIISWLNGEATYDCGLYSFKTKYWNSNYGDVFDYKSNINAYVDRISKYLTNNDFQTICNAIAQHYDQYKYSQKYVDDVLGRLNELWEVE